LERLGGNGLSLNQENIKIVEKAVLKLCIDNSDFLDRLGQNYFVTDKAKTFFNTLISLKDQQIPSTLRPVILSVQKEIPEFKTAEIKSVFEEEVSPKEFDLLFSSLKENYVKKQVEDLNADIIREVGKKSDVDWEKIEECGFKIQNYRDLIDDRKKEILYLEEAVDRYKEELDRRQAGISYADTGCSLLNSYLTEGFLGGMMTTVVGNPGSGKSSFVQYLNNKMINKFVPSLYFSKELPFTVTMDRFFGQRTDQNISEFKPKEDEEIASHILELINVESIKMSRNKRYGMLIAPSLDIRTLEKAIVSFRKDIKLQEEETLVVTLDLTTMLHDFNKSVSNKANDYEHGFNNLFMTGERTNTHFLNVVQLKRPSDKIKIKEIEDLDKLRPTPEMIKNSGVIEERSRNILGIHNPYYQARRYLSEDNPLFDIMDTHLEVQILKQNTGSVGSILKYDFDPKKSLLRPIYYTNTEG